MSSEVRTRPSRPGAIKSAGPGISKKKSIAKLKGVAGSTPDLTPYQLDRLSSSPLPSITLEFSTGYQPQHHHQQQQQQHQNQRYMAPEPVNFYRNQPQPPRQYLTPQTWSPTPYGQQQQQQQYPNPQSYQQDYSPIGFSPRHAYPTPPIGTASPMYSSSSYSNGVTPEQGNHFHAYPQSYPSVPYLPQVMSQDQYTGDKGGVMETEAEESPGGDDDVSDSEMGNYLELDDGPKDDLPGNDDGGSELESTVETDAKSLKKKASAAVLKAPPRPPNAWILYRSEKLRAIGKGEHIPELAAIMAETGVSSSTTSGSEDEATKGTTSATSFSEAEGNKDKTDMPPPPVPKMKKGKKGAKEPMEGLLKLGKGKTGRGLPQADISKMISLLWKREKAEVRARYERMSELKKLEHHEKYPGYKFQPLRKADKLKLREEREKEKLEIKREKVARSALRGMRGGGRGKARPRPTPSSPYGSVSGPSRPGPTPRSMSYSAPDPTAAGIAAGSQVFWLGTPEDGYPQRERDGQRNGQMSYPFPMPMGSLPSMNMDDPHGYYAPGQREMAPQPDTRGPPRNTQPLRHQASYPSFPTMETTSMHTQQQQLSQYVPENNYQDMPVPVSLDMSAFTQPDWQDMGQVGGYAVPYIFEPIPLPGEEFNLDNLTAGMNGEPADADSLAAMWCLLEEEVPGNNTIEQVPYAGGVWEVDADQAVDQWDQMNAPPMGVYSNGVELSSSIAAQIAADWEASGNQIDDSNFNQAGPSNYYSQPTYNPNMAYVELQYPGGDETTGEDPSSDRGLFLSSDQPLSPVDAWPPAGVPSLQLQGSNISNRNVSTSSISTAQARTPSNPLPSPGIPPPRHVSSSAFPSPPLSAEGGSWADRATSFSVFASAIGHEQNHTDDLWGSDDEDDTPNFAAASEGKKPSPLARNDSASSKSGLTSQSGTSPSISSGSGTPQ